MRKFSSVIIYIIISIICFGSAIQVKIWQEQKDWYVPAMPTILLILLFGTGTISTIIIFYIIIKRSNKYNLQKFILLLGVLVFVAMGIYPPWIKNTGTRAVPNTGAGSYSFIMNPPDNAKFIDLYRLGAQWCMVVVTTGGFILIIKDKKKE